MNPDQSEVDGSAEFAAAVPIDPGSEDFAKDVTEINPGKPTAAIPMVDTQHLGPATLIGSDGFGIVVETKIGPNMAG
jgi:hypothetical protein